MSNEIKKKRKALLDETAAHFNLNNRSTEFPTIIYQRCIYSGVGCAIGRKIEDKELCKKLDQSDPFMSKGSAVSNDYIFNQLPDHLRELGQDFLVDLQRLHDFAENWNENGLSGQGKHVYELILKQHC